MPSGLGSKPFGRNHDVLEISNDSMSLCIASACALFGSCVHSMAGQIAPLPSQNQIYLQEPATLLIFRRSHILIRNDCEYVQKVQK